MFFFLFSPQVGNKYAELTGVPTEPVIVRFFGIFFLFFQFSSVVGNLLASTSECTFSLLPTKMLPTYAAECLGLFCKTAVSCHGLFSKQAADRAKKVGGLPHFRILSTKTAKIFAEAGSVVFSQSQLIEGHKRDFVSLLLAGQGGFSIVLMA